MMLHNRRVWRFARWPALAAVAFILLAWMASTYHPSSAVFDRWGVESFGGLIVIRIWEPSGPFYQTSQDAVKEALRRPGLEWPVLSLGRFGSGYACVPYWLLFIPAAVMAIVAFWKAGRSYPRGCCGNCGYNLIGSPSGRCPECGAKGTIVGLGGLRP